MPYTATDYEDDDDDDEDDEDRGPRLHRDEYPDEADVQQSDSVETVPCPYCGRLIDEQAERCHRCGSYISREDAPHRYRWWIVMTVVVVILVMLFQWKA